jgi:hypothetical protein
MSDYYEKPKDWGVAPENNWVSGTPIGQSEVKMPNLGDPGSHENSSERVSFGDDGPEASMNWRVAPGGKRVRPGEPCLLGTETKGGACVPSKNAAGLSPTAIRKQFKRDDEEGKGEAGADASLKREVPKAPETDPQIRRIAKKGYKGRQA